MYVGCAGGGRRYRFHHPQQTTASGEELAAQGDRLAWEEAAIRAAVMAEEEEEVEVEGEGEEEGESAGELLLRETVATDAEPSPARKYGNRVDIDNMPVRACGRAGGRAASELYTRGAASLPLTRLLVCVRDWLGCIAAGSAGLWAVS